MTETEDTIFDASEFQGIKIEKEETVCEKLTFANEVKKEVESEEEEYWSEEEANCDGNIPCSFRKESVKVKKIRKIIKDSNSMTELEETKFDASDFPNIKFKREETIFEKLTFENEIKKEVPFAEVFWPQGKADCDGNFPSSFRDEKFPIRKDEEVAGISSSESHDAAKKEIGHKNDKQTGESSVNNDIYFSSEKCASDEDENIQASCSQYDYVSNDRRASYAHLKSFPCNTVGNHVGYIHGKEKTFKCTECDYASSRKNDLARHINYVHRKEKPFKCIECDYSSSRSIYLTNHIRSVHSNEKSFKCTECDYSSSQKSIITNHIRCVHRNEKPFKCTECDYSSSRKSIITNHIRFVHRKEKPFKCTECVHSYSQNGDLIRHIQSVHRKEKPFRCTECDYSCCRNETLTIHIRSVHRKEKPFKCSECDHSCSHNGDLTIHIRSVHKKERPYKCTECDYSCSQKGHLTNHIRSVHRKEKPFKCSECDYSCSRNADLIKHIRSVHEKKRTLKCF